MRKIPGKMETKCCFLNQMCLNLPIKALTALVHKEKKECENPLLPPPRTQAASGACLPLPNKALKFISSHTLHGARAHTHTLLQLPVSPGLQSISLLTDLRVGQDFQSFMTIYLSLQVSGGTQPDPQPLSQLLICLYGFILCVKPAHNSITVRVTKLSPECHK